MMPVLFAIGGALDLNGPVMQKFYEQCGGRAGKVVILPTASAFADSGEREAAALQAMGMQEKPIILPVRSREQAGNAEYQKALLNASGIFITGGNQLRLTSTLAGTSVLEALKAAYRQGCVIAGTSAGAAALSAFMIAYGQSGQAPRHGMVQLAPGLGLTEEIIFDQHFNQRNRLGRLIYVVTTTPNLLGIGVDENTAAVLEGNIVSVIGSGGVTIVDGSRMQDTTTPELEKKRLSAYTDICLHLLTDGGSFDLRNRKATLQKSLLITD